MAPCAFETCSCGSFVDNGDPDKFCQCGHHRKAHSAAIEPATPTNLSSRLSTSSLAHSAASQQKSSWTPILPVDRATSSGKGKGKATPSTKVTHYEARSEALGSKNRKAQSANTKSKRVAGKPAKDRQAEYIWCHVDVIQADDEDSLTEEANVDEYEKLPKINSDFVVDHNIRNRDQQDLLFLNDAIVQDYNAVPSNADKPIPDDWNHFPVGMSRDEVRGKISGFPSWRGVLNMLMDEEPDLYPFFVLSIKRNRAQVLRLPFQNGYTATEVGGLITTYSRPLHICTRRNLTDDERNRFFKQAPLRRLPPRSRQTSRQIRQVILSEDEDEEEFKEDSDSKDGSGDEHAEKQSRVPRTHKRMASQALSDHEQSPEARVHPRLRDVASGRSSPDLSDGAAFFAAVDGSVEHESYTEPASNPVTYIVDSSEDDDDHDLANAIEASRVEHSRGVDHRGADELSTPGAGSSRAGASVAAEAMAISGSGSGSDVIDRAFTEPHSGGTPAWEDASKIRFTAPGKKWVPKSF